MLLYVYLEGRRFILSYQIRVASAFGHYHVMSRGNNKLSIFNEERDKDKFMDYLRRTRDNQGFHILGYCIMPNHYHLLVQADSLPIMSRTMQKTNLAFSRFYQTKYNYVGHVYQGRYSSAGINTREYLYRVLRYIHNNPVKAGICNNPSEYPYSSYGEYIGRVEQDLLPEAGLLLLEKMGFSEVRSFHRFHGEKEEEDLGKAIRRNIVLGAPPPEDSREKELAYAIDLKSAFSNYDDLSRVEKMNFALLLMNRTRLLSKSAIARIAGVNRHSL